MVFPTPAGSLRAVDGITLQIPRGKVVGLVGESGSGKTITGRAIMRLVPRTGQITQGKIIFNGIDLLNASEESLRKLRGKELTSIQQDPVSSLNPAFTIQDQIVDIIRLHKMINKEKSISEAEKLLKGLGIADAKRVMGRYPHQISGGMAQRVMLAIAFSCNPSLVIADEPTTALDVITQATVIELMKSMQTRLGTSILFITHNLGLASKICDYVTVMYAGKIVESGTARQVFENPSHPYTQALLASVPKPTDTSTRLSTIEGSLPNIAPPQKGCRFYDRCKVAMDICRETEEIPYVEINHQVEHTSLCLRAKEVSDKLI